LDVFKANFLAKVEDKPFHLRPCFDNLKATTLYDTGPYFFAMAYYHAAH